MVAGEHGDPLDAQVAKELDCFTGLRPDGVFNRHGADHLSVACHEHDGAA